jgi:hypothetical protein
MAIDTANRRYSAVNVGSPWRGILPFPDGDVGYNDRKHVAFLYSGADQPGEFGENDYTIYGIAYSPYVLTGRASSTPEITGRAGSPYVLTGRSYTAKSITGRASLVTLTGKE